MTNLLDHLVTDRRHLVVDEDDLIRVLKAINAHHRITPELCVGNCGWADDQSKWFIHFTTTRSKWNELVDELNIVRTWNNGRVPKNTVGVVYSTD